jgi:phosphoadenosine phosphosulfate reductase
MDLQKITAALAPLNLVEKLSYLANNYANKIVFSTSFGLEDQIITHLIFSNNLPIKVFTLETGRLFPETYYVWNRTLEIYNKPIYTYYPQHNLVQEMLNTKGPNSFYLSVQNRKECCHIRKIEPLKRALAGNEIWLTGIRAEQSINREDMNDLEWDEGNKIIKFHPIFNWNLAQVREYIAANNIVYNTLHDKGFPSIGCQPCTRVVKPNEDFRAGRWWWEDQNKKECGLH